MLKILQQNILTAGHTMLAEMAMVHARIPSATNAKLRQLGLRNNYPQ